MNIREMLANLVLSATFVLCVLCCYFVSAGVGLGWAAAYPTSTLSSTSGSIGSTSITTGPSLLEQLLRKRGIDNFPSYLKYALDGHDVNNGGDHVRATFIKMGEKVLEFLNSTDEGIKLVTDYKLDYELLRAVLTINVISVAQGPLIDNNGSIVDALGVPGRIVLDHDRFFEHFEKDRDVYYLVFHEMLRAIAVNDDDYLISKALNPFRSNMKIITHVASKYPLLGDQLLSSVVLAKDMGINGSGCSSSANTFYADFDFERNILDISFKKYILGNVTSSPTSTTLMFRKNCAISIPVDLPSNKRLIVSQIDMTEKLDLKDVGVLVSMQFEAFLAGQSAPILKKEYSSVSSGLQGKLLLRRNDVLSSNCGGKDLLRLNTSSLMKMPTAGSSNMAEIEKITLYFKVEDCSISSTLTTAASSTR